MSDQQFSQSLNINWKKDIFPKIENIVYRTLKALQESQNTEQKANCFEIYGFDFILDEHMNPWVMEVNLSPACSERTPWLTKMLDDMAFGLTDWIERKILTNGWIELDNLSVDLQKKRHICLKKRELLENLKTLNQ
jgi:hypothetical protein